MNFERYLLLHLVTAVGRGQINDQLQLARCMIYVLVLEVALLCRVRPGQSFVQIHAAVYYTCADYHTPADGFQHL